MSALFHQYLINDSGEREESNMLLTIAAQTGEAAENVNGHEKECLHRLSSHIYRYEDKRSVLPCVAPAIDPH